MMPWTSFRIAALSIGVIVTVHAQTVHVLVTEPESSLETSSGLAPIYQMLTSASRTIDMTMYELADTAAEELLAQAAARGVAVRVILDRNLEQRNNQAAYDYLQSHGVQVVWANRKYAATHQKTIVMDGAVAAIMTLNLTSSYYGDTRDFAVLDADLRDIAAIIDVFNADFTGAAVTPPAGDGLVWSPVQSSAALVALIASAKSSPKIESEEMSDAPVVTALVKAARSGVRVQVTMTYASAYAANLTKLVDAGVEVGTYSSSAALYIHAKVVLADYGEKNASAFAGSENFSVASLQENRELGIILADPSILASVNETLTRDFNGAAPWR